MSADEGHLTRSALLRAARIDRQCRDEGALRPPDRGVARALGRIARGCEAAGQWLTRKARELFQHHWDVALFDVLFGSVKAFGVYPALYFAGLAWTIPIMEYVPLNTQLWTAGYLLARQQILSELGRRRYGHGLNRMDALRDRLLGIRTRDARSIHRFAHAGREWVLRVRRSRVRQWLERWRKIAPQPGVVLQAELRAMLSDAEFRRRVNPLRANAHLYERILIEKLLQSPAERAKLLAAAAPSQPTPGLSSEERALAALLTESPAPFLARAMEQGDSLAEALRGSPASLSGTTALVLRCLHRAHRRRIRRELAALAELEYRLLAHHLDGSALESSPLPAEIEEKRAQIRRWLERAGRFAEHAAGLRCEKRARRLASAAVARGRRCGLDVRMAAGLLALGAGGASGGGAARSTLALEAESSVR